MGDIIVLALIAVAVIFAIKQIRAKKHAITAINAVKVKIVKNNLSLKSIN